jgi:hypothetical protein
MPYKLQQIVTQQGHYITLPDLIDKLDGAVDALRAERRKGNQCRVVSVRPPMRGETGTQYDPVAIPDEKAERALRHLLSLDAYVSADDEAEWGLDYLTRDGIAGLAVLVMGRINDDLDEEVFPVDGQTRLDLASLGGVLAACGEEGGDPLVVVQTVISKRLAAAVEAKGGPKP